MNLSDQNLRTITWKDGSIDWQVAKMFHIPTGEEVVVEGKISDSSLTAMVSKARRLLTTKVKQRILNDAQRAEEATTIEA